MCSLWLPKAGNQPHEYEDAFWPARSSTREARVLRLAVADGATEASFSGLWARMLVRACGRGQIRPENLHEAISPLQTAWWAEVGRTPLPWYAEEKLRSGAFSSLLGLILKQRRHDGQLTWSALAVGDTCLFIVRDQALITSFPIHEAEFFDNSPQLISSVSARNHDLALCRDRGSALQGDRFYLATDALACWFLTRHEEGAEPWNCSTTSLELPHPSTSLTGWRTSGGGIGFGTTTLRCFDFAWSSVDVPWPTPQDYNEAIQNPAYTFSDPELQVGILRSHGPGAAETDHRQFRQRVSPALQGPRLGRALFLARAVRYATPVSRHKRASGECRAALHGGLRVSTQGIGFEAVGTRFSRWSGSRSVAQRLPRLSFDGPAALQSLMENWERMM